MEFAEFGKMVSDRLDSFAQGEIFVTVDGDRLWEVYLAAFPEGSNPLYKERPEHDCTCCKNFVRNVGGVVAVVDGKLTTLWDVPARSPYKEVAEALHTLVLSSPITDVWRTAERKYGAKTTKQMLAERQASANAAAKAAERQKLLAVLEKHQTTALENMSIEQVQARLAELN